MKTLLNVISILSLTVILIGITLCLATESYNFLHYILIALIVLILSSIPRILNVMERNNLLN